MKQIKKSLTPVVATALILVVAVLSVVNFESFYSSFESSVLADLNDNSNSISSLQVQGVFDNYLYLNSEGDSDLEILKVLSDNGSVMCDYNKGFDNSGLVGWWSFDDNFKDLSIYNSNNWTCINCPNSKNGILGNGLIFNNESHDRLEIIGNYSLGFNSRTYSFWFKGYDDLSGGYLLTNGAGNGYNGTRVYLGGSCDVMAIFGGTNSYFVLRGNKYVCDDNWHHLLYTINRNGYAKIYTDLFLGETIDISSLVLDDINSPDSLRFGQYANSIVDVDLYTADELKIFNKTLSDGEIQNLYSFNSINLNLSTGINQIGVPGCRLESGKSYDILIKTSNSNLFESTINVK